MLFQRRWAVIQKVGTPSGVQALLISLPVVSLVPRLTTGYRLESFRDFRGDVVGCVYERMAE